MGVVRPRDGPRFWPPRGPHEAPRAPSVLKVVSPAGFEPTAPRLGIWCSIQLSYGDDQTFLPRSRARAIACLLQLIPERNGFDRRSSPNVPPGP